MQSLGLILDMATGTSSQSSDKTYLPYCEPSIRDFVIKNREISVAMKVLHTPDLVLDSLVRKFPALFSSGVGLYTGKPHIIRIRSDAIPHRSRMREPPLAYAKMASDEIQNMLDQDLVEKIDTSDWVSPVHYVKKEGKVVRVTIDYSPGLNKSIVPSIHPLPRPSDIYEKAASAQFLSKMDLSKGYWHIPIAPESCGVTAFITPSHGLLQCK